MKQYRNIFVGVDQPVPLLNGSERVYINLDNAASTPSLLAVKNTIDRFLPYYSSVHRGTGFKSQVSTFAYDQARLDTLRFMGADKSTYTCIFGKNTSEAINKLAHRFPFSPQRNVVLVSSMEHHSNDLPWRKAAKVIHVRVTPQGSLDEGDFDTQLARYADRLALVAITGASNVTGYINPIHRLAEKTHAVGAQIAVDCAQLAPHRKIEMLPLEDPAHLDYASISAHKMYAPFGTGALIARKDVFAEGEPDYRGGGEVEIVTLDEVVWSEPPERDEAGSPNTVGAVALSAAIRQLELVGMAEVAEHEAELTAYALRRFGKMKGIKIYGEPDPETARQRLGVIPINLEGVSHYLAAAILGYEFGIGVRNGCFCAHPYILHLMGVDEEQASQVRQHILASDRRTVPGMLRVSFGLYNTLDEIDALMDALECIIGGKFAGEYVQDTASGAFAPRGWQMQYEDYCSAKLENNSYSKV
jgi:cysteine desulfurase/selenocysteine lyase